MTTTRTVAEKLRLKPDSALVLVADGEQRAALGTLPTGVREVDAGPEADAAVLFVRDAGELDARLELADANLRAAAPIWLVYPKGNRTDINRDNIWRRVETASWTLVANVSVDEVWSAVRMKPIG